MLGRVRITTWILMIAVGCGIYFGGKYAKEQGWIGETATVSAVPSKVNLPTIEDSKVPAPGSVAFTAPGLKAANLPGPCINRDLWAWNSQLGELGANGGKVTTEGSLMAKRGVCLHLNWQDDTAKNMENLIKFAQALSEGNLQPNVGAHVVGIMGDGAGQFLAAIQPQLQKLGQKAVIFGSMGFSRGEDKFMGPPECANSRDKKERQINCKGLLIAGVIKDGDWNIALKFAGDNEIRNNPDVTTYDPDAFNWVNAATYTDAADKYVANYSEDRKEVKNGRLTGKTVKVPVNAIVTWTPGDVTAAKKRGGLLSIVSTKDYNSQMPNTLIGIDSWLKANRKTVVNYLAAALEGGNQILASEAALDNAVRIAAGIWGEDAAYWKKYYRGTKERDAQNLMVDLGGSRVNNLADNLTLFGLVPGKANAFAATYERFGQIVVEQYPKDVPSIPAIADVLDTSYLEELAKAEPPSAPAEVVVYNAPTTLTPEISSRSWHINFVTGKATFSAGAEAQLKEMEQDLVIAGNTVVEIQGHTDNVGNPEKNMQLSEARALAVKAWLQHKAIKDFPDSRVTVSPQGSMKPVAPNSTSEGRAQNRRVEVRVLKNS